ncbi:unnamed protein product [Clonostachys chloroleuca]|uniref:Cytochrome P450 n=1 Tax=Clonostachys chloroleuca TaxID=1926264 RepID=A0AA35Q2L6_9HYPO|nr:unnamed protein product [Clonostachys chloroleuca]
MALTVILPILYLLGWFIFNVWFHPLRHFPGPLYLKATRLGFIYHQIKGTLPFDVLEWHKTYGDVVRIAPDELSFITPPALQDIQGHRAKGAPDFEKPEAFYRPVDGMEIDIISAGREEHSILRRLLSHGFSDKSLRDQQPIIMSYIDLLMQRLHENCAGGNKALNIMSWYNFATFDIIGDLAFGESFGCLTNSDYHPWVSLIFRMARAGAMIQGLGHYPMVKNFLLSLVPKSMGEERDHHLELTRDKLMRRMKRHEDRPDLIEGMLKKKDELGITMDQLQANSSILIIGGSETTATLLSGVTYFLLTNPQALLKVTQEVRERFKSEGGINFATVNDLSYMLGCHEALRLYPPVPAGLPRVTPRGGAEVCGQYIPDSGKSVHQWAVHHHEKLFKDPFEFHPERFMGDERYTQDVREAFQPFHLGPRNCLGRNLAYVEMRTILARLLFNFDIQIADDSRDWIKQKVFILLGETAVECLLDTGIQVMIYCSFGQQPFPRA